MKVSPVLVRQHNLPTACSIVGLVVSVGYGAVAIVRLQSEIIIVELLIDYQSSTRCVHNSLAILRVL